MVAAVTELMVGGERSTQDDSIKGSARTLVSKLRLRALLQATARTHLSLTTSSPLLTNTLTQTFLHSKLFPCIHTADHTFRQLPPRPACAYYFLGIFANVRRRECVDAIGTPTPRIMNLSLSNSNDLSRY